jgi:hypothetical protein
MVKRIDSEAFGLCCPDFADIFVCTCPMSARHIASTGRGLLMEERVPETVRFKYRAFLSYSHPDTRSTDMTGLQAELEAAFRKLPIAPPDDGIPYEWLIPGIGRQLALMKPVDCKIASPDAAKRKTRSLEKTRQDSL